MPPAPAPAPASAPETADVPSHVHRFAGYTPDKPSEELSHFSTRRLNFFPQPAIDMDAAAIPLNLLAGVDRRTSNIESIKFQTTLDPKLQSVVNAIGLACSTCSRVDPTLTQNYRYYYFVLLLFFSHFLLTTECFTN